MEEQMSLPGNHAVPEVPALLFSLQDPGEKQITHNLNTVFLKSVTIFSTKCGCLQLGPLVQQLLPLRLFRSVPE